MTPRRTYVIAGAFSSLLVRQARLDQHSCCILATNELADFQFAPQKLLAGYKGHSQAERGFRFLSAWQATDEQSKHHQLCGMCLRSGSSTGDSATDKIGDNNRAYL